MVNNVSWNYYNIDLIVFIVQWLTTKTHVTTWQAQDRDRKVTCYTTASMSVKSYRELDVQGTSLKVTFWPGLPQVLVAVSFLLNHASLSVESEGFKETVFGLSQ